MNFKTLILLLFTIALSHTSYSQNLPLNFKILNDYLRREQIQGNLNNEFSFNIRPINTTKSFPEYRNPFLIDSIISYEKKLNTLDKKLKIDPIPLQLLTVYNSNFPSGWKNNELVPAKGIQTLLSGGIYLRYGKLVIQFNPQFHYAQNLEFEEYPKDTPTEYYRYLRRSVSPIDNPIRFGEKSITKFHIGNSNIMLNLGSISFGMSSENIWSGPGQFNSLVISDNAPGFYHFRVQSSKPLKTFMGSFEGNYWIGKLDGSGLTYFSDSANTSTLDEKKDSDWRYFTGISISYSPKWTPGLFLGFTRGFQIYRKDMDNSLRSYFPILAPLPKEGEGEIENIERREDQNVSVFTRYLFTKAKTEIYFEYSRNDHPLNWRDMLLNPEHSRGYLIGFSKYVLLKQNLSIGFNGEIVQTHHSINNIVRWPNYLGASNSGLGSYDNYQVRHGWTHKGQILGANTGISSSTYIMKIGLYSGIKEVSIKLKGESKNPNFYSLAKTANLNINKWIDYSLYLNYSNSFKNLLVKSSFGLDKSYNYNYYSIINNDGFKLKNNNPINFTFNMDLVYLF